MLDAPLFPSRPSSWQMISAASVPLPAPVTYETTLPIIHLSSPCMLALLAPPAVLCWLPRHLGAPLCFWLPKRYYGMLCVTDFSPYPFHALSAAFMLWALSTWPLPSCSHVSTGHTAMSSEAHVGYAVLFQSKSGWHWPNMPSPLLYLLHIPVSAPLFRVLRRDERSTAKYFILQKLELLRCCVLPLSCDFPWLVSHFKWRPGETEVLLGDRKGMLFGVCKFCGPFIYNCYKVIYMIHLDLGPISYNICPWLSLWLPTCHASI